MVIALIAIGVIAFFAIDAYILYRVFASRASADDYGKFPVPGELSVMASGGKLRLSYQESYKAGGTEDTIDFGVPAALQVSVTGPDGRPLEIKGPGFKGMGSSLDTGRGWSRALVGTIELSQPGEYKVTASGAPQDAVEPQLLVGK